MATEEQKFYKRLIDEINAQGSTRNFELRKLDDADRQEDGDDENRFTLSFSSEEPYQRYFGMEILGHADGEARLDWLKSGNAPLLMEHDRGDLIGVVEFAEILADRGRAVVRFGNSERAQEIKRDVADGIRKNVSVGYRVHSMELVNKGEDIDTYRVTDWEPFEVSVVSIPADRTVGTNRAQAQTELNNPTLKKEVKTMSEENKPAERSAAEIELERQAAEKARAAEQARILADERKRVSDIEAMVRAHTGKLENIEALAEEARIGNHTAKRFGETIMGEYAKGAVVIPSVPEQSAGEKNDLSGFSVVEFVRQAMDGKLSGVYKEMDEEARNETRQSANGQSIRGFGIPFAILNRDFTVGTEGADIVQTTVQPNFIERFRNALVVREAGARYLTGLQGDVQFPRVSGGATFGWSTENGAATESTPTTDNLTLSPNRLAGTVDVSKQALIQSSADVQSMIEDELAYGAAAAIDLAALDGTGSSNQPTGIMNTSGVGEVQTDGGWTWAAVLEFEETLSAANARTGAAKWVVNAGVRGDLKGTSKDAGSGQFLQEGNLCNGYDVLVSEQMPASHAILGDFSELLIAQWGSIDVMVNPYAQQKAGIVEMTVDLFADIGVRHAASFVYTDGAA